MMTDLLVFVSLVIATTAIFGVWVICSISGEADKKDYRHDSPF